MTQAERDRLEGVSEIPPGRTSMRESIQLAKRIQITKAAGFCQQGCGAKVIYWGGAAEIETGRTCHVCRAANVLYLMFAGGR